MNHKIANCPECGEPFYTYSMIVRDQSRCNKCESKLKCRIEENESRSSDDLDNSFSISMPNFDFGGSDSGSGFSGGGGDFGGGGASGDF